MAIIGILAAIAIPGYIGMQERSRKGAVIRAASASEPEVQAWLLSAFQGVSTGAVGAGAKREVDSNGDGTITIADYNNSQLGSFWNVGSLSCAYVNAKQAMYSEMSPWNPGTSLWSASAVASSQMIIVSQSNASSALSVVASDKLNIIHNKAFYAE